MTSTTVGSLARLASALFMLEAQNALPPETVACDPPPEFAPSLPNVITRRELWGLGTQAQRNVATGLPPAAHVAAMYEAVIAATHPKSDQVPTFETLCARVWADLQERDDTKACGVQLFVRFLNAITIPVDELETAVEEPAGNSATGSPNREHGATSGEPDARRPGSAPDGTPSGTPVNATGVARTATAAGADGGAGVPDAVDGNMPTSPNRRCSSSSTTSAVETPGYSPSPDGARRFVVHPDVALFVSAENFSMAWLMIESICIARVFHDSSYSLAEQLHQKGLSVEPIHQVRIVHNNYILGILRYDVAAMAPGMFLKFMRETDAAGTEGRAVDEILSLARVACNMLMCTSEGATALPSTVAAATLYASLHRYAGGAAVPGIAVTASQMQLARLASRLVVQHIQTQQYASPKALRR